MIWYSFCKRYKENSLEKVCGALYHPQEMKVITLECKMPHWACHLLLMKGGGGEQELTVQAVLYKKKTHKQFHCARY